MKQILFASSLISFYFIAINCTPIVTIPTEETDSDGFNETCKDLNIMMHASHPILKGITKYFVTFCNSDLLSAHATCKWFYKYASKILNERTKPLIITNGTISDTTMQEIFSKFEQQNHVNSENFAILQDWQSDIILLFDKCNNPTPKEHLPYARICLQIIPYNNHFEIHTSYYTRNGKLGNKHPRNGVIIPKNYPIMYDYKSFISGFFSMFNVTEWIEMRDDVKLIIVFQNPSSHDLSTIGHRFGQFAKKYPIPICYVLQPDRNLPNANQNMITSRELACLVFFGNNVEVAVFSIDTTDEKELRKKLLTWKHGLDFLESHHIIAFHFTKEFMKPTNSEEIFREIFDIQPATLRLSASELAKIGLVYCNSTTDLDNHPGALYAIVGFKKF